jgi:hypothetical protein
MVEVSPRGICGGQSGIEASFSSRTSVVPCYDVPPMMRTDFSLTDSTLIQKKTASLNNTHKLTPEH